MSEPKPWNFRHLLLALFIGVSMQAAGLSDFVDSCAVTCPIALMFDVLYLARVARAYWKKETGRGWILYIVLMYTSPYWIMLMFKCFEGSLRLHYRIVH
jgi:hypothetical protein